MQNSEVQIELDKFGKRLVQASRSSLTQQKVSASGELYKSIGYDLTVSPNSFQFAFGSTLPYSTFQDRGVSGTKKKYKTPFSYKSSSKVVGMELATGTFASWAKQKGIKPRSKKVGSKGQFITYKSFGIAIAANKKKFGIKPKNFITRPFKNAFKALPDALIEAYGLELDRTLLR